MHDFSRRLRERKIARWTIAYLADAWLVYQVATLVGQNFAWPLVVLQILTVVLVVGFFAVLTVAWYHGEKGAQRVTWPELGMLAALLVIAGVGVAMVRGEPAPGSGEPHDALAGAGFALVPDLAPVERSVAVLPFTSLSPDAENEYFSDGITEDILTQLSGIADLRVISRTSVMGYKGTTRNLREIAAELGVAHILEGSVRRVDDRVRIVAQLIDARTDQHLWADTYDRDLTDIFQIQSEIAQRIAAALQARLTIAERERLEGRPTADLVAYDLYLLGREHLHRETASDNETAVSLFRRATELDPSFAHAYAGMAEAYWKKVNRFAQPLEWADSGVQMARKAVALDPDLADGYTAMASAYYVQGLLSRVRGPAERAVRLNPNDARALTTLGNLETQAGRLADAIGYYGRVATLDPGRS
jgi:TolB-like protein/cytochrome c-type biogenesis protein CcmH/NrfG